MFIFWSADTCPYCRINSQVKIKFSRHHIFDAIYPTYPIRKRIKFPNVMTRLPVLEYTKPSKLRLISLKVPAWLTQYVVFDKLYSEKKKKTTGVMPQLKKEKKGVHMLDVSKTPEPGKKWPS